MADLAEQWHSWQDEIFPGFPGPSKPRRVADHWAAALWPGPLKPTAGMLSMLSRLAQPLAEMPPDWGIPVPPIFARCTARLDPAEELAAVTLYWQAVTRALPVASPDATRRALEAAVTHNPHVAEPRLMLAQLALGAEQWEEAARQAGAALALLGDWGVAWDKRIAWSGWVAWARILQQSAEKRRWPEMLPGLNGLGLVEG
ncbi:hypothetical protein JMJ55_22290 [Belnapia sp. T6]|uniref:Tetratricopeptide repeat-containing protein n=1 Tax=Belnapia mucosa TaxID=2804532 RepID=A0ABS1V8S6_9PROT|nr:hypothetical protein [Belnapia mucosa]